MGTPTEGEIESRDSKGLVAAKRNPNQSADKATNHEVSRNPKFNLHSSQAKLTNINSTAKGREIPLEGDHEKDKRARDNSNPNLNPNGKKHTFSEFIAMVIARNRELRKTNQSKGIVPQVERGNLSSNTLYPGQYPGLNSTNSTWSSSSSNGGNSWLGNLDIDRERYVVTLFWVTIGGVAFVCFAIVLLALSWCAYKFRKRSKKRAKQRLMLAREVMRPPPLSDTSVSSSFTHASVDQKNETEHAGNKNKYKLTNNSCCPKGGPNRVVVIKPSTAIRVVRRTSNSSTIGPNSKRGTKETTPLPTSNHHVEVKRDVVNSCNNKDKWAPFKIGQINGMYEHTPESDDDNEEYKRVTFGMFGQSDEVILNPNNISFDQQKSKSHERRRTNSKNLDQDTLPKSDRQKKREKRHKRDSEHSVFSNSNDINNIDTRFSTASLNSMVNGPVLNNQNTGNMVRDKKLISQSHPNRLIKREIVDSVNQTGTMTTTTTKVSSKPRKSLMEALEDLAKGDPTAMADYAPAETELRQPPMLSPSPINTDDSEEGNYPPYSYSCFHPNDINQFNRIPIKQFNNQNWNSKLPYKRSLNDDLNEDIYRCSGRSRYSEDGIINGYAAKNKISNLTPDNKLINGKPRNLTQIGSPTTPLSPLKMALHLNAHNNVNERKFRRSWPRRNPQPTNLNQNNKRTNMDKEKALPNHVMPSNYIKTNVAFLPEIHKPKNGVSVSGYTDKLLRMQCFKPLEDKIRSQMRQRSLFSATASNKKSGFKEIEPNEEFNMSSPLADISQESIDEEWKKVVKDIQNLSII